MTWDPEQYLKFEQERNQPLRDLLTAVDPSAISSVMDLGCGPGNSTEYIHQRFAELWSKDPKAKLEGLDSSPAMIEAARIRLPDITFHLGDIAQWKNTNKYSLIVANAVLQWLPDHKTLFPSLLDHLAPQGCLAIQMPDNLEEPAHTLMREVAGSRRWAEKLSAARMARAPRRPASFYYDVLRPHVSSIEIWQTTYMHVLPNVDAIIEWFKGSGLRPYLDPLTETEKSVFLEAYRRKIKAAYREQTDKCVLLPYPRLFIVATRT